MPLEDNPQGGAWVRQFQVDGQGKGAAARHNLERHCCLLQAEALERLGEFLDGRPNPVDWQGQIRSRRQKNIEGAILAVGLAECIPRHQEPALPLRVCLALALALALMAVGGADAKDSFTAAQLADPLAVALEIAAAGLAQTAWMRVDDPEHPQIASSLWRTMRAATAWAVLSNCTWAAPALRWLPAGKVAIATA